MLMQDVVSCCAWQQCFSSLWCCSTCGAPQTGALFQVFRLYCIRLVTSAGLARALFRYGIVVIPENPRNNMVKANTVRLTGSRTASSCAAWLSECVSDVEGTPTLIT